MQGQGRFGLELAAKSRRLTGRITIVGERKVSFRHFFLRIAGHQEVDPGLSSQTHRGALVVHLRIVIVHEVSVWNTPFVSLLVVYHLLPLELGCLEPVAREHVAAMSRIATHAAEPLSWENYVSFVVSD